jgi:uncharacterized protein (DUF983 family)
VTVSAGASVAKFAFFCVPISVMGHVSVAAAKMIYRTFNYTAWVVVIVVATLHLLN